MPMLLFKLKYLQRRVAWKNSNEKKVGCSMSDRLLPGTCTYNMGEDTVRRAQGYKMIHSLRPTFFTKQMAIEET